MPFLFDDMREIAVKSLDIGISFDISEDMTRQEFKQECDVNHILAQHGYVARPVVYGEHNFDEDLTAKMQSRSVFQAWYDSAPLDVREMYPDLGSFLAAVGSGAINTGTEVAEEPSATSDPSASPPAAGALG